MPRIKPLSFTERAAADARERRKKNEALMAGYWQMVRKCSDETHARMFRDFNELRWYYKLSSATHYGVIAPFNELEEQGGDFGYGAMGPTFPTHPNGWRLVMPAIMTIPRNRTADQLYSTLKLWADKLPLLPHGVAP